MFIIQDIIINLLRTTVISSILILFILILKATWLKKYNKNLNHYIWIFVIIRLIIPIEIPIRYIFSEENKLIQANDILVSIQNSIHFDTYFYIFIRINTVFFPDKIKIMLHLKIRKLYFFQHSRL